jgi:hypothetical protein
MIDKEVAVACFEFLYRHLPGVKQGEDEKRPLLARSRVELGTSR